MDRKKFAQLHGAGDTSRDVVEAALKGRTEDEFVDFKLKIDTTLPEEACWADLCRDIIAFYNQNGGYLIFGINDNFEVAGFDEADRFDSKKINDKIKRYTSIIRVTYSWMIYDNKKIAIIYIPSRGDAPVAWVEKDGPPKGKKANIFRKNDSFIRVGDEVQELQINKLNDLFRFVSSEGEGGIKYQESRMRRLIAPDYNSFIGRSDSKDSILKFLNPDHRCITVNVGGVGGVGKSALAIWATHKIDDLGWYDVIISISAKEKELVSSGIQSVKREVYTYDQLLKEIIRAYEYDPPETMNIEQLEEYVLRLFEMGSCLLFIDNYETVTDVRIENFIQNKFAESRLSKNKALITSRNKVIPGEYPLGLAGLDSEELLLLYADLCGHFALADLVSADQKTRNNIIEASGGLPLGLKYILGNIALRNKNGSDFKLEMYTNFDMSNLLEYCFRSMFDAMTEEDQKVLLGIAIIGDLTDIDSVSVAVGLNNEIVEKSIHSLSHIMLIREIPIMGEYTKYSILPITKNFALGQIRNNPKFRRFEEECNIKIADHIRSFESESKERSTFESKLLQRLKVDNTDNQSLIMRTSANIAIKRNDFDKARDLMNRAILSSNVDDIKGIVLFDWASMEWSLGNLIDADNLYSEALAVSKDTKLRSKIARSWSDMHRASKNYRRAAEKMQIAVDNSPRDIKQIKQLGFLQSLSGQYGTAEKTYLKLLSNSTIEEKDLRVIRNWRIHNFYKAGDLTRAREALAYAIDIDGMTHELKETKVRFGF